MADYFVKVNDGRELRRQLLESSKLSIYILKQEYKIKELRMRKEQLTQKVRDDLKELTFLLGSLEKELPALTKKELAEMAPKPIVKVAKKQAKVTAAPKQDKPAEKHSDEFDKLRRLENSLEMIEKRLSNL